MRFRLSVLCLLFSVLGLTACAKRETPVAEGIRTKTLLIGNQNEPATLDPDLIDAATDTNIAFALYESLTSFDEKTGAAVPGVAERWEISPDGLTYTFHLRASAQWSNGDRVTARDFAYSFERQLAPAHASPYAYYLWSIKNAEAFTAGTVKNFADVGVTVLDDATLRLTLAHPAPYLLGLLAQSLPVHQATVEKFGTRDDRSSPWARPGRLVSNGPFTLTEWTPNARIVVTKNPHYWGAAGNQIDRVIFFPIEKADTEELNFRAGQLHVTFGLPASKIASYRAQSPEKLRTDPLLQTLMLNFNTTKPPLDNGKVRRALALALDRTAIAQRVLNGAGLPAHTLVPPNCGGYALPAGQPDDFAAARALLAEAGFPGGKGFPTITLQVRNDDKLPRIAEALQAMWRRELGIQITIEPYEQKTWLQNQQTLTHTLALKNWTADCPDPISFLETYRTGNGANWSGWSNKAYDALLDQAATSADPTTRFALLQQAETLMLDEAAVAPIVFGSRTYAIHPEVKNWEPAVLGVRRFQRVELRN